MDCQSLTHKVLSSVSFTSLSSFRQTTRNVDFSGVMHCH